MVPPQQPRAMGCGQATLCPGVPTPRLDRWYNEGRASSASFPTATQTLALCGARKPLMNE